MNVPIELVVVGAGSIIALQGWILKEVIAIKVKISHYDDLERRIVSLEQFKEDLTT